MGSDDLAMFLRGWGVELDPMDRSYGDWNEILFGHRSGQPCVIKLCGNGHNADHEGAALTAWNGDGAVRLLASGRHVLLLERLDPDRTLATVAMSDAIGIFAELLQRLSIRAPGGLPALTDTARTMSDADVSSEVVPDPWMAVVRQLASELADDAGDTLVHGDLHSDNILAGTRAPWLAIDPKPAAGHPERSLAEFLWTRLHEVDDIPSTLTRLVREASLDAERARAWTVVRTASYLIWALDNGLTEDPIRCRRLLSALI